MPCIALESFLELAATDSVECHLQAVNLVGKTFNERMYVGWVNCFRISVCFPRWMFLTICDGECRNSRMGGVATVTQPYHTYEWKVRSFVCLFVEHFEE